MPISGTVSEIQRLSCRKSQIYLPPSIAPVNGLLLLDKNLDTRLTNCNETFVDSAKSALCDFTQELKLTHVNEACRQTQNVITSCLLLLLLLITQFTPVLLVLTHHG